MEYEIRGLVMFPSVMWTAAMVDFPFACKCLHSFVLIIIQNSSEYNDNFVQIGDCVGQC